MFAPNQPPYYAYAGEKTLGGMLCNTSGVAIDENGQVLARETFRPIPGLFAAGNTAGSRFGIQYTTALCGVSIAFAVTQGKFTGEYVAPPLPPSHPAYSCPAITCPRHLSPGAFTPKGPQLPLWALAGQRQICRRG